VVTPLSPDCEGCYKGDNNSFLFSLTNPANLPSKMKDKAQGLPPTVYHHYSYGPTFGGGHDLHISNCSNTNRSSFVNPASYDFPKTIHDPSIERFIHGESNFYFNTVEVEVFQVI
jgi:hypothetical protein